MKIAVTGKGGAGKTTLAVYLSRYLADLDRPVYLLDADPDANAALALGLDARDHPLPLSELRELIEERTESGSGAGGFFKLNPKVDDVPERYSVDCRGVRLLRTGRVKKGGSGCLCPENAFLSSVLAHMFFGNDAWVILDMEAGIEHLGRATAQGVDAMLVVVEPGRRSVQTAHDVARLAADIGINCVGAVLNKLQGGEAEELERMLRPMPVLAWLPFDSSVAAADMEGGCAYRGAEVQKQVVSGLLEKIEELKSAGDDGEKDSEARAAGAENEKQVNSEGRKKQEIHE